MGHPIPFRGDRRRDLKAWATRRSAVDPSKINTRSLRPTHALVTARARLTASRDDEPERTMTIPDRFSDREWGEPKERALIRPSGTKFASPETGLYTRKNPARRSPPVILITVQH
jgi:hypothetical protein